MKKGYELKIDLEEMDIDFYRVINVPEKASFNDLNVFISWLFGFYDLKEFNFDLDLDLDKSITSYFKDNKTLKYTQGNWKFTITAKEIEYKKLSPQVIKLEPELNVLEEISPYEFNQLIRFLSHKSCDSSINYEDLIPLLTKMGFESYSKFFNYKIIDCSEKLELKESEGYNIKLRLKNFRPITWRDLIIPQNITFKQLHEYIQVIFDFLDYHLYEFTLNSYTVVTDFERQDMEMASFMREEITFLDSNETYIDEYFKKMKKIEYNYDFGDDWNILIEIKGVKPLNQNYPKLVRYKGKYNPIEDIGGPYTLMDALLLKDDVNNPYHEELEYVYDELSEFDMEDVQDDLELMHDDF